MSRKSYGKHLILTLSLSMQAAFARGIINNQTHILWYFTAWEVKMSGELENTYKDPSLSYTERGNTGRLSALRVGLWTNGRLVYLRIKERKVPTAFHFWSFICMLILCGKNNMPFHPLYIYVLFRKSCRIPFFCFDPFCYFIRRNYSSFLEEQSKIFLP